MNNTMSKLARCFLAFKRTRTIVNIGALLVCASACLANQTMREDPKSDKEASDRSLTKTVFNIEEELIKTRLETVRHKTGEKNEAKIEVKTKSDSLSIGGDLGSGNSGVRYAPFTDADLEKIKATQAPFTLGIRYSEIGDADLERIVGNPHIAKISLVDVPKLTDVAVEKLARLPNVKSIWLVKIPQLKNPNFAALADCKSLTSLHLTSCANLSPESLAGLADCKGLKFLQLQACPVSDATLAQLAKSRSLTTVLLVGCSELTDAGLAQLSGAANLKWLLLEGNLKLTEEGVDALREKLPQTKIIFAP